MLHQKNLFTENLGSSHSFEDSVREFREFGRVTLEEDGEFCPVFTNEFWTSGQRQAHSLHEISYRACFKPQLPRFFIERLTCIGDVVYDPFMGRGTTPLEAALLGRGIIGNDVNPLSRLLARPRIKPVNVMDVSERLSEIDLEKDAFDEAEDLVPFFHRQTQNELSNLRKYFLERENSGSFDYIDDWIRMVAINRLTGHSPGFFSVYTLPPNQAASPSAQRKINEKRNQSPVPRDIRRIILKKTRSLLRDDFSCTVNDFSFLCSEAHNTPEIKNESVSLTVTSPPFLDVVQYSKDNWMRSWFANIDPSSVKISMYRDVNDWRRYIQKVLNEIFRVTKKGGYLAFEVGEVRNGKVLLEREVLFASQKTQWTPVCVMINKQDFTKTANAWGVKNNSKGTNTNRIVILKK